MTSVGQKLRQAREGRGLSIQQVAAQTKISSRYLQAIEADDPKSLPGLFFYKSFVQQYAHSLGLPTDEFRWELERIVPTERISDDSTVDPPPPQARFLREPEPITAQLGFRIGVLIVMLIACSAVYAIWDKMQRTAAIQATQTPEGRAVTREAAKELRAAPPPTTVPTAASTTQGSSPASPATSGDTPAATNIPPPITTGRGSLQVTATEAAWFRLTLDGKVVYAGVLQPKETKTFDGFEKANLLVGNAGGIDVMLNGKPVGSIGPRGQVRTVTFTPDKFEVQPVNRDPDSPGAGL